MQSNIENLTEEQIIALEPWQIDADNQCRYQLRYHRRALFLKIEKAEQEHYRGLEPWQIESMNKLRNQLRALFPTTEPEQFSILRRNDALKTKEQVLELSKQNPCLIALLSVHEIMGLTKAQIRALTQEQFEALTEEEIQALLPRQIKALTTEQISWLTEEQILALLPLQIRALTQEQFEALTPDQIEALRPIMNLIKAQNMDLTEEQILALDYCRIKALTKAQIRALTTEPGQIWVLIYSMLKALKEQEEIAALSYSMQELNVNPNSPRESQRAHSWAEVVVEGTTIIEKGLGKC